MKNKNLITIGAIVLTVGVAYFLMRGRKPKKQDAQTNPQVENKPSESNNSAEFIGGENKGGLPRLRQNPRTTSVVEPVLTAAAAPTLKVLNAFKRRKAKRTWNY